MNKYVNILISILTQTNAVYRYPGELLERCLVAFPQDRFEVLDAFLTVLENITSTKEQSLAKKLKEAKGFNSNQIAQFVLAVNNWDGATLQYLLTGVHTEFTEPSFSDRKEYLKLWHYVSCAFADSSSGSAVIPFKDWLLSNVQSLYGASDSKFYGIVDFLLDKTIPSTVLLSRGEIKFLRLFRKMTENVLSDADVTALQIYGYSTLSARRANLKLLRTTVKGRHSKVLYQYLNCLFFGEEVATEEDKTLSSALLDKHFRTPLECSINGTRGLMDSLLRPIASSKCANVPLVVNSFLKYNDSYNTCWISILMKNILVTDPVISELPMHFQIQFLITRLQVQNSVEIRNTAWQELLKRKETKEFRFVYQSNLLLNGVNDGIISIDFLETVSEHILEQLLLDAFLNPIAVSSTLISRFGSNENFGEALYHMISYRYCDYYKVKGIGFTEEQIKELYQVKEEFFFRYAPEKYLDFLVDVALTTGETIHSKEDWKFLLELTSDRTKNQLELALLTKTEYAELSALRKSKQEAQQRKECLDEIANLKSVDEIRWYYSFKDDASVGRALYQKIMTLPLESDRADNTIIQLLLTDAISEEEFLEYFRLRKHDRLNRRVSA